MSKPLGQTTVPISGSTRTWAKKLGWASGSATPRPSPRSGKLTSPTTPSSKVRRRRWSPRTSTPVTSTSLSIGAILGQWSDRCRWFFVDNALPVRVQLVGVQFGPVLDMAERSLREEADDDLAREVERGLVLAVARVEVGAGVVGLVPVHRDRD